MQPQMNKTVLMSGANYFDDGFAINPFMDSSAVVNVNVAISEHTSLRTQLESEGIRVVNTPAPAGLQDGVYTANWALVRGDNAIMAHLPPSRQPEVVHAEAALRSLGKHIHHLPSNLRFSGQGDSLPCGNYLFCGSGYRTDPEAHAFVAKVLGYTLVELQTIPQLDERAKPVINPVSGWPDSYFYDLDLALAVLRPPVSTNKGLIAWCPEAFMPKSRELLTRFDAVEKIEVDFFEAKEAFACNLLSTGSAVFMSAHAPRLRASIEAYGLKTIPIDMPELAKGGGFIRCTTLTLDNL